MRTQNFAECVIFHCPFVRHNMRIRLLTFVFNSVCFQNKQQIIIICNITLIFLIMQAFYSFLRFNFDKDSKIGLSQTKTNRKNPMFPMKASVTLLFNLANPVTSYKRSYLFRGELLYFFQKINNTIRGLLTLSRPASEVFLRRSLYPT